MRNRFENKKTVVGLIIIFALLFFCAGVSVYQAFLPVITIEAEDITIRQDEVLPNIKVHIKFSGKEHVILDEVSGYSTKHLVDELDQGIGFQVKNTVNQSEEGNYPIEISLDVVLKKKLVFLWNQKVRYRIKDGTVKILNKFGDWEGRRFKMLDGTYASGWTNLGNDTYYFDEKGTCATGKYQVDGMTYYFKKNGMFDTKKNPVNPTRPMIALTFDDGPGPYTMQLLERLEQYESRASFFMVGYNVGKYPDAIHKMKEMECDIGNHTTNHTRLTLQNPDSVINEIATTNVWIQNILGEGASLVRPPYGAYNETVQAVAGAPLIMWSMDTKDWELKNAELVRDFVLANVKDGDIILLHDIHESTVQATMELIPLLKERGYQLVTVSEMAKVRGVTLENGSVYKSFP